MDFKDEKNLDFSYGAQNEHHIRTTMEKEFDRNREMRHSYAHMLQANVPWEIADVKDRIPRLIGEAEHDCIRAKFDHRRAACGDAQNNWGNTSQLGNPCPPREHGDGDRG